MSRAAGEGEEARARGYVPPRGSLPIWRRRGKGLFLGRDVRVTVTDCTPSTVRLAVEAPLSVVVSAPPTSLEDHLASQLDRDSREGMEGKDLVVVLLARGEAVRIGRCGSITYDGEQEGGRASLLVEAPLNVAVTRDVFTFEEHMRTQERREGGGRR